MGEIKPILTPACRAFDKWAREFDEKFGISEVPEEEPAAPLTLDKLDILDKIDELTAVGAQAVAETILI